MPKATRLLLVLSLSGLALLGIFYALQAYQSNMLGDRYGERHQMGVYSTGGNAGVISFSDTPYGYSGAEVIGYGTSEVSLTGIFWIETVGWATFSESPVSLIPPSSGNNIRDPWYLSGYAWSPNAGWIALNHGEPYASGVALLPDKGLLVGYGYSPSLGWIPFGDPSGTGVTISINNGFIGKVGIAGTIGGSKTFNVLYDVGGSFNAASMTKFINVVHKNIALLLRNAGPKINTDLTGLGAQSFNKSMIFRVESNPSSQFLRYSNVKNAMNFDSARSLIVIGADILIDDDVLNLLSSPRAIIALKNEKGQGGNIFIKGTVKKIESVIFAEGSVISGDDFFPPGGLSPYYVKKESVFLDIPRNQLYIKGAVGSFNTIGGSSKDGGAVCPYGSNDLGACTYDSAVKYDMNYFRIYDGSPAMRAYTDDSKDAYSLIIEYDPRIIQDPPPGLETLN